MEIPDAIEQPEAAESPPVAPPEPAQWPAGVEPDDPPRPHCRRWVKGQSGNPAGRPPKRAHVAAFVARSLINRKAIPLTRKQIDLALAGDKTMLRLLHQSVAPARREAPVDLQLPPIEDRAGARAAMKAVADAAMNGTITSAQGRTLAQMLLSVLYAI